MSFFEEKKVQVKINETVNKIIEKVKLQKGVVGVEMNRKLETKTLISGKKV